MLSDYNRLNEISFSFLRTNVAIFLLWSVQTIRTSWEDLSINYLLFEFHLVHAKADDVNYDKFSKCLSFTIVKLKVKHKNQKNLYAIFIRKIYPQFLSAKFIRNIYPQFLSANFYPQIYPQSVHAFSTRPFVHAWFMRVPNLHTAPKRHLIKIRTFLRNGER